MRRVPLQYGHIAPVEHNRDRAVNLMGLYDENDSGSLEQEEWNRIGSGWDEADVDGNGVLSLDELSERFTAHEQPLPGSEDESPSPKSPAVASEDRHQPARAQIHKANAASSRRPRSYRRRTPHERLPMGIPGWYIQMDADRDGQIMMVEYAKAWNDEKLAEFNRYDFNRDGVITPRECLKAETPR